MLRQDSVLELHTRHNLKFKPFWLFGDAIFGSNQVSKSLVRIVRIDQSQCEKV